MNKRRNTHSKIKSEHALVGFIILCILLLGISTVAPSNTKIISNFAGITILPMQKGINSIGNKLVIQKNAKRENKKLKKENERLNDVIESLKKENESLHQDRYELEKLEKLYKLDKKYSKYEKEGAHIISKGNGNWFDIFVIDKGAKDGIKVNMNVIGASVDIDEFNKNSDKKKSNKKDLLNGGLVGIVYEVSDHYAKVRSVINDTSMVSAMVLSTQDNCIIRGSTETMNKGYLEVVYLDKDSKIKKGDQLVTSNISSKFIEGITVGTVTEVSKSTDGLTKTAKMEPVVDFQHLQEVLVVKHVKKTVVLDESVKE